MSDKRQLEDIFADIHKDMAESVLTRVREAKSGSGEPLSAAEVNAITKFLKDNDITVENLPGKSNAADRLAKELASVPFSAEDEGDYVPH